MIFKNRKEFKALFLSFYTPLCNYAHNAVQNMSNAEDIVQEVFIHLWENRDSLEVEGEISNYLFRSVRNKILEFVRTRKTYEKHKRQAIEHQLQQADVKEVTDIYLKLERINTSLRHLPPKCKKVFVLHKFKGLTYTEIAEVENISVKTVENHMIKALKLLRKYIKEEAH